MRNIGLDVHKVKTQVCVQDEAGKLLHKARLPTSRDAISEALRGFLPARVLLEASTESEWVARSLERDGFEVVVADPNFLPMYGTLRRNVKTDERDAKALADAARTGVFRRANRPTDKQMAQRRVLRSRRLLVRQRSSTISLVRALFRQLGIRVRSCEAEKFRSVVMSEPLPGELSPSVRPLLDTLAMLADSIDALDRQIDKLQDADTELMRTAPGVGSLVALTLIAALGAPERFSGAHQAEAFLGLVPREMSSGERRTRGAISKAGSSEARAMLVQAAWTIVRDQSPQTTALRAWFTRLRDRRGAKAAIVALARRLAGFLWAMWRDRKPFDPRLTGGMKGKPYRLTQSAA